MKRALDTEVDCLELSISAIPLDIWKEHIFSKVSPTTLFVLRFVNKTARATINTLLTKDLYVSMLDEHDRNQEISSCGSVSLYDWFVSMDNIIIRWYWGYFMNAAKNGHLALVRHTRKEMLRTIPPSLRHTDHRTLSTMMGGYNIIDSCLSFGEIVKHGSMELISAVIDFFMDLDLPYYYDYITQKIGTRRFLAIIFKSAIQSGNMDVIKFIGAGLRAHGSAIVAGMVNAIISYAAPEQIHPILNLFNFGTLDANLLIFSALKHPDPNVLKCILKNINSSDGLDVCQGVSVSMLMDVQKLELILGFFAHYSPNNVLNDDFYRTCIRDAIFVHRWEALDWLISKGSELTGLCHSDIFTGDLKYALRNNIMETTTNKECLSSILTKHGL